MELAGPLGTLLGSAQWKRASSRGEAGTSGFLSNSDSDCTVPAVLGQESHASSCLRNGILVASRVVPGVSGPLSSCVTVQGVPRARYAWATKTRTGMFEMAHMDKGRELCLWNVTKPLAIIMSDCGLCVCVLFSVYHSNF